VRWLVISLLLLGGCNKTGDDPGLDALLRVGNGQFYRGPLPTVTSGPPISSFMGGSSIVRPGQLSAPLTGIVTRDTTAVAIQLEGDPGYWIVTPGAEDPTQLNQLGFSAKVSYSPLLPSGTFNIVARAANIKGAYGPSSTLKIMTADAMVADTLLVSLRWDTEADLDLHLVIPDGSEIWSNKINSYTPPQAGSGGDPNAWKAGGILDFDSNANCNIDGRRLENIFWTQPPPSGHYIARVDTYSLCAATQADWELVVTHNGQSLGRASGTGRDSDAALPHGAMAGVTALTFDIP
jgi:hypothetical protein